MFGFRDAFFYLIAFQVTLIKFLKKIYFTTNYYNKSLKSKIPNQVYFNPNSYLLSIISAIILTNFNFGEEIPINWFIFVVIISTISQLGDIIISYFKRLSKIKDTGKIIPGHGGLLDRVDGMIFVFPISYLIFLIDF